MVLKHILKLTTFLLFVISISSCEDWLDVKPKTEIDSDDLFSTEDGFKSSLAGIYTALTEVSLYGKETTYGLIGVLGMEWSVTTGQLTNSTNEYYNAKNYDYSNTLVKTKIDRIWSNGYNIIANINKLIEYTEKNKSVLTDVNYGVIRGEAYALRAFIHFDLLRMFAPYSFNSSEIYLPYSETTLAKVSVQRTNAEIINKILADLKKSEALLTVDPIFTKQNYSEIDNGYLANRHFHLNYWAVKALKARVYLYENKKDSALFEAESVILAQKEGHFPWVTSDDISRTDVNLRDRTFSSEHLFALNNTRMKDQIVGYFIGTTTPLFTRLSVTNFGEGALFSEQSDYRYFFESDNGVSNISSKFWQMDDSNGETPKKNRIPLIRISEVYYIAAECLAEEDLSKALSYLRKVQENRGLTTMIAPNASYETLRIELLSEYQREFLGEGQLFFYHKRQGTAIIYNANANYCFPLPDSETEFRN